MTRLPSLSAFPPAARARIKASPQYRALEAAERAREPRPELAGYDSMPEKLFAGVLASRRLAKEIREARYHALRIYTPGGNRWTPDFVVDARWPDDKLIEIRAPYEDVDWLRGATLYEVQAAPWRMKSKDPKRKGRLAQHHSKRAQRIVHKEIRAALPWLRIVIAEHQRGGGFKEAVLK